MDDANHLCLGCWRSIDEIIAWSTMGDAAKAQVWVGIAQRQLKQQAVVWSAPERKP
jgi:uncharacterized protein